MNSLAALDLRKLQAMGALVGLLYEPFQVVPITSEYDYEREELAVSLSVLNTGSGEGRSPRKNNVEN